MFFFEHIDNVHGIVIGSLQFPDIQTEFDYFANIHPASLFDLPYHVIEDIRHIKTYAYFYTILLQYYNYCNVYSTGSSRGDEYQWQ